MRCDVVCVVWCGVVRCGVVWCGVACCVVVWCGVVCTPAILAEWARHGSPAHYHAAHGYWQVSASLDYNFMVGGSYQLVLHSSSWSSLVEVIDPKR